MPWCLQPFAEGWRRGSTLGSYLASKHPPYFTAGLCWGGLHGCAVREVPSERRGIGRRGGHNEKRRGSKRISRWICHHTQCPFCRGLCCDRPMAAARWRWNGTNGINVLLPTIFSLHHLRSTDTEPQKHFPLWVLVYLATSASDLSGSMKYQSLCQAAWIGRERHH